MPATHIVLTSPRFRQFKPEAIEVIFRHNTGETSIYLPMKHLLIQGARPYDPAIHAANNNFQGGYRCALVIVSQPAHGSVVIDEDKLGFLYVPQGRMWSGHDSFSYKLVSYLGQESDAQCAHVFIGI